MTGAAGFIGSHVVEALVAIGHDVVGLDCFTDHYPVEAKRANAAAVAALGVETRALDLRTDDLRDVVADVDVVLHLAGRPGLGSEDLAAYLLDNTVATERLVNAVEEVNAGLHLFVNVATSSVYGRYATADETAVPAPVSAYGISKLAAEHVVRRAATLRGLAACSLRPFSVYGPRERPEKLLPRLLAAAYGGPPFPLFDGSEAHRRSYTYVGDVAAAIVSTIAHRDRCMGAVCNIGHPESHATAELIELVTSLTGRSVPCIAAPARTGDLLETKAVIDTARRLLDYAPKVSIREGVLLQAEWFAQNMADAVAPEGHRDRDRRVSA